MAMNTMAGMGRPPAMGGMPPSMGAAPMGQAPTPQMSGAAPSVGNVMQITSTLRGMSDQQLQQYAAMHKSDPFVFPLAFQESQTRQQMRAGQAAQMAGQKPPPVVDQDLAQMTPPAPMGLPEDQGIGALNAPNLQRMADGGIVGYADGGQQPGMFNYAQMAPAVDLHPDSGVTPRSMAAGGIAHFADEGAVKDKPDYRQMIIDSAIANGVDPKVALRIAGVEGTGKNSKSSATNFFQFIDKTYKDLGGDPALRHDPIEAIRLGGLFLGKNQKALEKSLGRAPEPHELYGTHFLGEPVGKALLTANPKQTVAEFLKNTTPKEAGDIIKANPEVLGSKGEKTVGDVRNWTKLKMAGLGLPAANAAVGLPKDTSTAGMIPGQNVKAPASNYDQTNTYFGGLADRLGIPQEYQRNISNTLNALGGYSSPVSSVGRGVGMASKALEPTAEMIAKAEQAKNAVALPRIAAPAKVIEGLTPEAQAMRDAAIQARQVRALEADKQAALGAEQSVNAATQTSDIARKMEESIANARRVGATAKIPGTEKAITLGGRLNEAKMSGATQGLAAMNDAEKAIQGSDISSFAPATAYPNYNATTEAEDASFGPRTPLKGTETVPTTGEIAKTVTGEKKGRNWDDIMLNTGLGLLAGKSPYALQNLGEAGLNALQIERAQTKEDREQKLAELHGKYYESAGKQAEANANYIADERGQNALMAKAAAVTEQSLKAWMDSQANNGVPIAPEDIRAVRAQLFKQTLGMMGLQIPSTMASNGPTPGAIQVLGVRPS